MYYYLLNETFDIVDIVENYTSMLWVDRYSDIGDIEIVTNDMAFGNKCRPDYYVVSNESDRAMIIEDISKTIDPEAGASIKITGRSLESILCRRIISKQISLNGNLQTEITRLLSENITSPKDADRTIRNFRIEASNDSYIQSKTVTTEPLLGKSVFDVVKAICEVYGIGFKVALRDKQFVFTLYNGIDRSYDVKNINPVIFSPKLDNLINSSYAEVTSSEKNIAVVLGKDQNEKDLLVIVGEGAGLKRKETYVSATDVDSKDESGSYNESEYQKKLMQRGYESLLENRKQLGFDGEAVPNQSYVYGKDYMIGDIVEVENEFGKTSKSRIVEYIHSYDENEYKAYPTFIII